MKTARGFALALLCGVASALSLPAVAADSAQVFVNTGDVKWMDVPPALPKGAKIAVLYGDPFKSGPFVIRLMAPAGYKIAPHWHSQTENLTIVSGTLFLGDGDKMDTGHSHALKTGGFHYLPAKAHHYAFTKVATVVQIHGDGPFDINWVNEKDDPQKMAKQ